MIKFSFTSQPIDKIVCELMLLLHFEEDVPLQGNLGVVDWRINGRLSHLLKNQRFSGKAREMVLMPAERRFRSDKLIVMGLGPQAGFHEDHVSQVIDYILETSKNMQAAQICLSLSKFNPSPFAWRNAIRLLVSKIVDYPLIREIILCEPEDIVQEAKRRHLDFGSQVQVEFV